MRTIKFDFENDDSTDMQVLDEDGNVLGTIGYDCSIIDAAHIAAQCACEHAGIQFDGLEGW